MPKFYEFFAGGGMARAGLGDGWTCLFANDFDGKKCRAYEQNWGADVLVRGRVQELNAIQLPGTADLAWASFPCQDLSLAGAGAGLRGERSGTFWPFWDLIEGLRAERREPKIVVLENVVGALSSHKGKDFAAIGSAIAGAGYLFGAVVVDAAHFVPHSRPRLFIMAVSGEIDLPEFVVDSGPNAAWHPKNLKAAFEGLSESAKKKWVWWKMPNPPLRGSVLADLVEKDSANVVWHTKAETKRLLSLMSPVNRNKVKEAQELGCNVVGAVYKRTRKGKDGIRYQRAEVRFDDLAGCLRTPTGGSSRQTIMLINGKNIRSRLLTARETARLMGLPEAYILPDKYNDAYHLTGDGVVVPVVRFLAGAVLEPILAVQVKGRGLRQQFQRGASRSSSEKVNHPNFPSESLPPSTRSKIMRAVKGKDTRPEMMLRRLISSLGFRYRLHRADLPGKPDLVFSGIKRVIFVNGCFWHGHDCRRGARIPKTNSDYWKHKIEANRKRDFDNIQKLAEQGWVTETVWECELSDRAGLEKRMREFLDASQKSGQSAFEENSYMESTPMEPDDGKSVIS